MLPIFDTGTGRPGRIGSSSVSAVSATTLRAESRMTISRSRYLPQEILLPLKRMLSSKGVAERVDLCLPTLPKAKRALYPLWFELWPEPMIGWIGFCEAKCQINVPWRNRLASMNDISAELSPWPF